MVSNEDVEVFYKGEVLTRKEALKLKLKRYFTGEICKYGHVAQRITNSGRCCECNRLSTIKWKNESCSKGDADTYHNFKSLPELVDLNRWLTYDSVSGDIFWNRRDPAEFVSVKSSKIWNSKYEGKIAGSQHYSNNYIEIRLPDGKLYKAHRLAWKMFYGAEPKRIIDHINGVANDNRIINLREATHKENSRNMKVVGCVDYKGVSLTEDGKYTSGITVNSLRIDLGNYVTAEDAARAYDRAAKELFKEFAYLNFPEEE